MPSQYLQPSDYLVYGLPTSTTVPQVTQASLCIDAYLLRPEGLVYMPDAMGQPCYMAGLTPQMTFKSQGAISPGANVVVTLAEQILPSNDMIGEVLILDRTNANAVEACVISAVALGQFTLSKVVNSHSSNCTMETGLVIVEEKPLPSERSIMRTNRPPVRVLSGMGRYAYGRRTDQAAGLYNSVNLLAIINAFGGPPQWVPFDVAQASCSQTTREVWVPSGILLAYYSDVRLRYVSGFSQTGLPSIIKEATAMLVSNFQQYPELTGQLRSIGAGSTKIERFAPSQLDIHIIQMLNTYRMNLII